MSPLQWTISALLTVHLAALTLSAVPFPEPWSDLEGIRDLPGPYVKNLAVEQRWNMFAPPGRFKQYLRLRYFWRDKGGIESQDETVYPPTSETLRQPVQAYRAGFERKAVSNALKNQRRTARKELTSRKAHVDTEVNHLSPILRSFGERFRQRALWSSTRNKLVRIEGWIGSQPIRPPGRPEYEYELEQPLPIGQRTDQPNPHGFASPGTVETEGPIQWRLVAVVQP